MRRADTSLLLRLLIVGAIGAGSLPACAHASEPAFVHQPAPTSQFGSATSMPPDPQPLGSAEGVAVNEATGEVYVSDGSNNRVERFSSAGVYEGQFNGSGSDPAVEGGPAADGELSSPRGIAVDSNPESPSFGDVYVIDTGHAVIDKFSATGSYEGDLTSFSGPAPAAIATDAHGRVFIYGSADGVSKCNNEPVNECRLLFATGFFVQPAIAVDGPDEVFVGRGNGSMLQYSALGVKLGEVAVCCQYAFDGGNHLLVDEEGSITDYGTGTPSYAPLQQLGAGELAGSTSIAVDRANGNIYATSAAPAPGVQVFAGEPAAPAAVGGATALSASIGRTSATFEGSLDPRGSATTYRIAYVEAAAYDPGAANPYGAGGVSEASTTAEEFGDKQVVVRVQGLAPGTTYHFALLAGNQAGSALGPDGAFTTSAPSPPVVTTGAASDVSQSSATLAGTVGTDGLQTLYAFEIGTQPGAYGPPTGLGELGGATTQTVSLDLRELQPATTYYYRIEATNADGTSYGAQASFSTPAFPTGIAVPAALPILATPTIAFPTNVTGSPTNAKKKAVQTRKAKACPRRPGPRRRACERRAGAKRGGRSGKRK